MEETEFAKACVRPGCETKVVDGKAFGSVTLELERRLESEDFRTLDVDVWGEICAGCTNDLADWWLLGKK